MGLTRPLPHREALRGGPKGSAASRQPLKRPASPKVSLDRPVKPSLDGRSCLFKVAQTGSPWPIGWSHQDTPGRTGHLYCVRQERRENLFKVAFLFYHLQIPKAAETLGFTIHEQQASSTGHLSAWI